MDDVLGDQNELNPGGSELARSIAEPACRTTVDGGASAFPIVGIGASAGGLEAFRRLLGSLPNDTGMAYVLIQHLDPHHESILTELLAQSTQLAVSEVKSDVLVAPDHIYVIPPSKFLVLIDGMLRVSPRSPVGSVPMPIDSFLRSLADARGTQAIGVLLSGMGSDGTLGLQAIEAAGGLTFAQEPASAKYDDMPCNAIRAGRIDFVLPPEGIAIELMRLGRHPYLAIGRAENAANSTSSATQVNRTAEEGESLARVLELLRQASGTDFTGYKQSMVRRRIERRMAVRRVEMLRAYALILERDAAEVLALHDDCLISVTSFFRDPTAFESISERALPLLSNPSSSDEPIRMWVAGCATGEEVYSIAMCMLEQKAALSCNRSFQIFATDLSEHALATAREGSYPSTISCHVSAERLRRFFCKVDGHYRINKTVREMCVFARHDLTRDPPYSRMDLISCRNVLIYLEPPLQDMLLATFHYALRPEGILVLGTAETVGLSSALFAVVDERHRIYARKAAVGPSRLLSARRDARSLLSDARPRRARDRATISDVSHETDRVLLARFGAAGVVVNANLQVLEFRGDMDPFLDHSHGKASLNLEHLLRRGLLMELRQAIEEAHRANVTVRREQLRVTYREELRSVNVEVIPLKAGETDERYVLVMFEMDMLDRRSVSPPGKRPAGQVARLGHRIRSMWDWSGVRRDRPGRHYQAPPRSERRSSLSALVGSDTKDGEITRLGQGLAQTTEYMHTLVREHESALENLQSTTEEALSGNEELLSLNEELQTAKEEIQSANEELATLNQELQDRNGQLARSNDDIQHGLDNANALVDAVPQPLVILDGELRIVKANFSFYAKFETTAERTRSRLLSEIGGGQWSKPPLLTALRQILAGGAKVEELEVEVELATVGVRNMFVNAQRLHPERATGWHILLAIEDRTEAKRAERQREAVLVLEHDARERAEAADHLKDQFVATVSHELRGPINVISGWMNILLAAGKSPDAALLSKALTAIGRGVAAQTRLISDLFDHSRIVAGKVELQRAAIDLMTVAEAALVGVRAAADAKDIDVLLSGDHAMSIVLGDADRMQQVLWNLFLNAIKFTPPGGSVRIAVGRVGNQVHITVTDNGRGIPADFLPHVFDRFRQAEGSSNRAHQGLGLGLTLVRELVELHGGMVRATSPGPDQGATFTVILPIPALLQPAAESELPPAPESEAPPSMRPPAFLALPVDMLNGTTLLVVDDEADARDALVALLERYGARVRTATSVAEAMASLAEHLPDAMISDIGMSGEDGYDLIRKVRLLPECAGGRLPSLAVSAYATAEHRKKVISSGFQTYLEKPVSPAELVTEVARLAGR